MSFSTTTRSITRHTPLPGCARPSAKCLGTHRGKPSYSRECLSNASTKRRGGRERRKNEYGQSVAEAEALAAQSASSDADDAARYSALYCAGVSYWDVFGFTPLFGLKTILAFLTTPGIQGEQDIRRDHGPTA